MIRSLVDELGLTRPIARELTRTVAERLKARRIGGAQNRLIVILVVIVIALVGVIGYVLATSTLFRQPTALELAREELEASLAQNPDDPAILMTLAEVEYELGRQDEALEYAKRASELSGEIQEINLRYAILLIKEMRLDEAQSTLEAELAVNPVSSEAYFLLGQVMREREEYDEALTHFESALQFNPVDGDYRLLYAQTLALAGRTDEAIDWYQRALQVLPGDARAIQGLEDLGVTYEATETVSPHGSDTSDQ